MVTQQGVSSVSIQVQLEEGNRFTTSVRIPGLADAATATFYIENPAGSGKVVLFDPPAQNATGKIYVDSYKNPTLDTQGTAIETPNARFDGADDSVANAYGGETTAISGGTLLGETVAGTTTSGGSEKAAQGEPQSASLLLTPGDSFGIEITNESGASVDIASAIAFIEVPEDAITESP